MLRMDLINALELAAPALAVNPHIPILTHFWFTGKSVVAFNDRIGIEVPLVTGLMAFAAPGELLLNMLKASRAKEITVTLPAGPDAGNVMVKAATARMLFPFLPATDFLFEMPKLTNTNNLSREFITAIKTCLRPTTDKDSSPEERGVTIIKQNDQLLFFSTDRMTITHARIAPSSGAPKWTAERIILPMLFCKQLIEITKQAKSIRFELHTDHIVVKADDAMLYGQLIDQGTSAPLNFIEAYERFTHPIKKHSMIEIPSKLNLIFDRATILAGDKFTSIYTRDGKMFFKTQSENGGEVVDSIALKHPEVIIKVKPKQVKSNLKNFSRMLFTNNCIIMSNDVGTHLISALVT